MRIVREFTVDSNKEIAAILRNQFPTMEGEESSIAVIYNVNGKQLSELIGGDEWTIDVCEKLCRVMEEHGEDSYPWDLDSLCQEVEFVNGQELRERAAEIVNVRNVDLLPVGELADIMQAEDPYYTIHQLDEDLWAIW